MARFLIVAVLFLAALSAVMAMKQQNLTRIQPNQYRLRVYSTCDKVNLNLRCEAVEKGVFFNSKLKKVISTSVHTSSRSQLNIKLDMVLKPPTKKPNNGTGAGQINVNNH